MDELMILIGLLMVCFSEQDGVGFGLLAYGILLYAIEKAK